MTQNKFYKKSASYWAKVPATVNGVLGGFGHISDIDINGSKVFLNDLLMLKDPFDTKTALDCGAGIGRVSKNLLIPYFDKVDLIEQDKKFINTAKEVIGSNNEKLGTLYQKSLQQFKPDKKYDLIWCQWVLGYLTDKDLVIFLRKCRQSLATNGLIVIKENVTGSNEYDYDDEDYSVTRPYKMMITLFQQSNLEIIKTDIQTGFPEDIYSVHMFALKPN
ncbi:alpha N-terminal protein methyltransferase 1-like [Battus philenor]|uniref:alpha N-terminal protein methyltransferase 1-like n=1 Tax=Battus philenor TaxID=42288 RepID=UPI0035CEBC8B